MNKHLTLEYNTNNLNNSENNPVLDNEEIEEIEENIVHIPEKIQEQPLNKKEYIKDDKDNNSKYDLDNTNSDIKKIPNTSYEQNKNINAYKDSNENYDDINSIVNNYLNNSKKNKIEIDWQDKFKELVYKIYPQEIYLYYKNKRISTNYDVEKAHQKTLIILLGSNDVKEDIYKSLTHYYLNSYRYYEGIQLVENNIYKLKDKGYFYAVLALLYYEINKNSNPHTYVNNIYLSIESKSYPYIHMIAGYIYSKTNNFTEAISFFNTANELTPEISEINILKAKCYESNQMYNQAILQYSILYKLNKDNSYILDIANVYYNSQKWTNALQSYNNYLDKLNNKDSSLIDKINYKRFICYLFNDNIEECIKTLNIILNSNSIQLNSYKENLNIINNNIQDIVDSKYYDEKIISAHFYIKKKLNLKNTTNTEWLEYHENHIEEAKLTNKYKYYNIKIEIANLYFKLDNHQKALSNIKDVLHIYPNLNKALFILAKIWYYDKEKTKLGIKIFKKIHNIYIEQPEIDFYLGEYYFQQNNYNKSIDCLSNIYSNIYIKLEVLKYKYLGISYLKINQFKNAEKYIILYYKNFKMEDSLEDSLNVVKELNENYIKLKDFKSSIYFLEKLLNIRECNNIDKMLKNSYIKQCSVIIESSKK